jgi:hypothetical protein
VVAKKQIHTVMVEAFNVEKLIKKGSISSELEYERALEASKSLRLLGKDNSKYVLIRKKVLGIIEDFERREWKNIENVTELKIKESDDAEAYLAQERAFIIQRQKKITQRLKAMNMTQGDLTTILGHKSKTYISELMNGLSPFTLHDLVILHHFLSIEMKDLVPTYLNLQDRERLKKVSVELKM